MSKTITIKVKDNDKQEEENFSITYTGETPGSDEWDEILAFEDEHVGGRPTDR